MKKNTPYTCISRCLLAFSLLFFGFETQALAQAGTLDATFGTSGITSTNFSATRDDLFPRRGAMQSDGKALSLMRSGRNTSGFTDVVIRYETDGSIDETFASGGFLFMNWNPNSVCCGFAYDVKLQMVGGDEKILVAGSYGGSGTLRIDRYNSNGTPDLSFDSDGTAVHNVGYALTITAQPDGKIWGVGDVGALVRLNVNGSLDSSFGTGGVVQLSGIRGYALSLQPTGKILMGGAGSVKGKNVLAVFRFNADGTLDDGGRRDSTPGDSFGTAGQTAIEFFSQGTLSTDTRNEWMKTDSSGKILFTCEASPKNSTNGYFAIARLTKDGLFDSSFNGNGKATVNLTSLRDSPRSVTFQSDGKIILTGVAARDQAVTSNLGMARLHSNGTLDTSFGANGIVVRDFSDKAEWNHAGFVQFDPQCACEKIVTLGMAEVALVDYAVAARFLLQ